MKDWPVRLIRRKPSGGGRCILKPPPKRQKREHVTTFWRDLETVPVGDLAARDVVDAEKLREEFAYLEEG